MRRVLTDIKIKVIDAMCGKGKTSWAIEYINSCPDKSFVYCTPFLNEIQRMKDACSCSRNFHEPKALDGRKLNGFNSLLMNGTDVVVTHATFTNANADTETYISNGHYTLILDEVLDIIVDFNSACNENLKTGDYKLLVNKNLIEVDQYGKVTWKDESYKNSKYDKVEQLAKSGMLYFIDNTFMVWQFPPELFRQFDEVYVLTYMFQGSIMKPYFEYHGLEYELQTVIKDETGSYQLVEWFPDTEDRAYYRSLITIVDNAKMNNYKNMKLSKNWFINSKKDDLQKLKRHLHNFFTNITEAKSAEILWTCQKDYQNKLSGGGYKVVRRLSPEEKELDDAERKRMEDQLSCFAPVNSRSTNMYADRSVLAYVYNPFCNPYIKRYFMNKNDIDGTDIQMDENYYALANLIQWIFRSRIRNGQSITIYIPSVRMRTLLQKWLDGEM